MILPLEHDQLYLSEEALFTQGFFVHEHFSLATPVDADYVALRPILNINKVLVNLQWVLIQGLYNLCLIDSSRAVISQGGWQVFGFNFQVWGRAIFVANIFGPTADLIALVLRALGISEPCLHGVSEAVGRWAELAE